MDADHHVSCDKELHVLAVGIPDDNHVVDMRDTQVRLGKVS